METLLERLQGHGGRRQSGVDNGRDQGARDADELGDTGVMPLSSPLPPEPTKHNLWHLDEQGELAQPRRQCGRQRGGWGPWRGILGAPSTNLCFSPSWLAGLKVRPGVVAWSALSLQPSHGALSLALTPTQNTGSDGALLEVGEPHQHPRAWAAVEGMVAEEEEEEEEEALGKDCQEGLPGSRDLLLEPQEEQVPTPALQTPGRACRAPQIAFGPLPHYSWGTLPHYQDIPLQSRAPHVALSAPSRASMAWLGFNLLGAAG